MKLSDTYPWLALAILVVAGSGVPELAALMRYTLVLVLVYLLLTHVADVARLTDKLVTGLRPA